MNQALTETQRVLQQLLRVWADFEGRLLKVPVVERAMQGRLRIEDYRCLLWDHRQQVVDGARWIARAASSITAEYGELRSQFIRHAATEHRDYEMLEADFAAVGGDVKAMRQGEKNLGSEALSAWMFHRASQSNPFDLLGAMFIIEGLGLRFAQGFSQSIQRQLGLNEEQVRFYRYHAEHDEDHLAELEEALNSGILAIPGMAAAIVKTAKVTARLYLLQLEELGNY